MKLHFFMSLCGYSWSGNFHKDWTNLQPKLLSTLICSMLTFPMLGRIINLLSSFFHSPPLIYTVWLYTQCFWSILSLVFPSWKLKVPCCALWEMIGIPINMWNSWVSAVEKFRWASTSHAIQYCFACFYGKGNATQSTVHGFFQLWISLFYLSLTTTDVGSLSIPYP